MAYPSTFLDLQNEVINKLRLDATADLPKVKDWINRVYFRVVSETGANATYATMALTANSYSYTLPAAIERINGMFITPVGATASLPLIPTSLDDLIRKRQAAGGTAQAVGQVTHYALLGISEFEVWPTPQSADVITVYYVTAPTALTANTDIPILHEPWATDLLTYGALAEAADFKGDPAEPEYRAIFEDYRRRYLAHLARKGPRVDHFLLPPTVGIGYPPHDPSVDIVGWSY